MHVLLFIFYSFVLGYAVTRIPFFRHSGIRPFYLQLYLGLRVVTGCLHNVIAYRYYPKHGDIWLFFNNSLASRRELFTDLPAFWADNSTWAYLPHNLIEWMHILFNFLSFDNLYINTLFFSFFTLAGGIALFRVFISRFRGDLLSACCVLLLPSTLFWTSCIHTEGILYTLLGFYFYQLNRLLNRGDFPDGPAANASPVDGSPVDRPIAPGGSSRLARTYPARLVLRCIFLFAVSVFFRPAILIGLLPASLFWILATYRRPQVQHISQQEIQGISRRGLRTILVSTAALLILALVIPGLFTPILRSLSARQQEFQALTGNSRIVLPILEPTWGSFGRVLPYALLNGFFQPLPGSGGQAIYSAFSVELVLIWLVIVFSVSRAFFTSRPPTFPPSAPPGPGAHRPLNARQPSLPGGSEFSGSRPFFLSWFGLGCLLFSFLGMLLIGYIIPFVGSIIRYRSLYLPFLLVPFLYTLRNSRVLSGLNDRLTKKILQS